MPAVPRLQGLIAASFTPMRPNGGLNLAGVPALVERYLATGVRGIYVCGSTGEGPLLTTAERMLVAEAFVEAAAKRMPVVIQVGHNSVFDAKELAKHAAGIGADAISAVAPSYFRPGNAAALVQCCAEVSAAAPSLPFYYYHIPVISGVHIDIVSFLGEAAAAIPDFAGVKFSDRAFDQMHRCAGTEGGRFEVLAGVDEMLLSALAIGIRGAVGSFYNFSARLFNAVIEAFDAGRIDEARALQAQAVELVHILSAAGGLPAFKRAMTLSGVDCGPVRLPLQPVSDAAWDAALARMDAAGLTRWLT